MNILYHLPFLPPARPAAEALYQEITLLRRHFDGELVYVNPNARLPVRLPRLTFGWQRLAGLRRREQSAALHHFYNPEPFAYPYLLALRRPVVYSLTGEVGPRRPNLPFFRRMAAITVLDESSLAKLRNWGLGNVHLVRPGIDCSRFSVAPPPPLDKFHLLMASAPWTKAQFASKGIDALLAAAYQRPTLHLTLLWRGVLAEEAAARVRSLGLEGRVQLIDRQVDVNTALAQAHAAVVLATHGILVKGYPHSLLDALAAGRPVLVSRAIPMSAYVAAAGCGEVVETVTPAALLAAVDRLAAAYPARQTAAQAAAADFDYARMVNDYTQVYAATLRQGRTAWACPARSSTP